MAAETWVSHRDTHRFKGIEWPPIPCPGVTLVQRQAAEGDRAQPLTRPTRPTRCMPCVQEIGEGKVGVVMAWVWMSQVGVAAWRKVVARGCGC